MDESQAPTVLIIESDAQMAESVRQKVKNELGKLSVVASNVVVAKTLLEMFFYELVIVGQEFRVRLKAAYNLCRNYGVTLIRQTMMF